MSPLWLVAAAPALLAAGLWAVADIQRFLFVAVLPAMIIPAALIKPGGAQIALADVLLFVTLGIWLVLGAVGRVPPVRLYGNRLLLPALIFVAVNAESAGWSVSEAATAKFTIQLFELIVIFPLVFASLPQSLGSIRRGFLAYVGFSCILAIVVVVVYAPHAEAGDLQGRSLALGLQKNTAGSVIGAGLVMAYVLCAAETHRRTKRLLAFAVVIETLGLFSTVSRASIIGALVAIIAVSLLLRQWRRVTLTLAALAAITYIATIGLVSHAAPVPGAYDSSTVRVYSWADAVHKIERRPLLGTGGGTYTDYIRPLALTLPDPNNMFLLTWAELGIGGLFSLFFLLGTFGRMLLRTNRLPGEYATFAVAAGGVSLSLLVHFQFDVTWTRGTSSLAFSMMGLMLALERLAPASGRLASAPVRPRLQLGPTPAYAVAEAD